MRENVLLDDAEAQSQRWGSLYLSQWFTPGVSARYEVFLSKQVIVWPII